MYMFMCMYMFISHNCDQKQNECYSISQHLAPSSIDSTHEDRFLSQFWCTYLYLYIYIYTHTYTKTHVFYNLIDTKQ